MQGQGSRLQSNIEISRGKWLNNSSCLTFYSLKTICYSIFNWTVGSGELLLGFYTQERISLFWNILGQMVHFVVQQINTLHTRSELQPQKTAIYTALNLSFRIRNCFVSLRPVNQCVTYREFIVLCVWWWRRNKSTGTESRQPRSTCFWHKENLHTNTYVQTVRHKLWKVTDYKNYVLLERELCAYRPWLQCTPEWLLILVVLHQWQWQGTHKACSAAQTRK